MSNAHRAALEEKRIQVLRSLDKRDRVGVDGVIKLLTTGRVDHSGDFTPGVGLSQAQAVTMLGLLDCVDACFNPGDTRSVRVASRFALIARLDETVIDAATGRTAWDALIDLPVNDDGTWTFDGGIRRPRNIAWALDDLVDILQQVTAPS